VSAEQIAKDLQDSGLFGKYAAKDLSGRTDHLPNPVKWIINDLPWPDADTSEAILVAMGLQVVWNYRSNAYQLCLVTHQSSDSPDDPDYYFPRLLLLHHLGPAEKHSIARNAALAWLSKQHAWLPKLKAVIEEVRG